MGQVTLGLRSLMVRGAVFFIMAALLAWALGGTLWPRLEIVNFDPISFGGREWFWRLSVGGRQVEPTLWTLIVRTAEEPESPADGRTWRDVTGPLVADDTLFIAGRATAESGAAGWQIVRFERDGRRQEHSMPDRLAVEQQLLRVVEGLPMQDASTILRERAFVLQPGTAPPAAEER